MDQKLQKDVHEEIVHIHAKFGNHVPFRQSEGHHPFFGKKCLIKIYPHPHGTEKIKKRGFSNRETFFVNKQIISK